MPVPPALLLGIRLVLAAVFGAAGMAKLRDRGGTRTALTEFGVPELLARPVGVLLPLAELGVAASLLVTPAARVGALGALALLVLFSVAIAVNLARGRTPDCHCFGQVHSTPIGPATLGRNATLGTLSVLLVVQGPGLGLRGALDRLGDLSVAGRLGLAAGLLGGLVLVAMGWLILQLMHQQGRLLLRIEALEGSPGLGEGLAVGMQAPDFSLTSVSGQTLSLRELVVPGRTLLALFVSPTCRPCNALLPDLAHWQHEHAAVLSIAVLARGDEAANRAKAAKHRLEPVLLDPEAEVARAYRAMPTPSAVLIDADGRVRSPVAAGADAIRGLVVRVVDARGEVAGRRADHTHGSEGRGPVSPRSDDLQPAHGGIVDGRAV
jgi:peroxiredoxin/uncharacterized membrane protein YphA (DoxX/SURF4 family)